MRNWLNDFAIYIMLGLYAVLVFTLIAVASIGQIEKITSYYNGIYDSCMVIGNKLVQGYDEKEYAEADEFCSQLRENAMDADAFHNRPELEPKESIDG